MMINFNNLANIIDGNGSCKEETFNKVVIDSRIVSNGDLFIAIKGEQFDGHDFIEDAISNGASCIISSKEINGQSYMVVKDTVKALGQLASYHRLQHQIKFIALTGSCGKTTTKEMIANICLRNGTTLYTKGNFNNHIGVPLTLFRLNKEHQFAVIELGANAPGEIKYTSSIAKPSIGLITNIAPAHVEGFGSVEGVAKAKSEIFLAIDNGGLAVVHIDAYKKYKAIRDASAHLNTITFGFSNKADIHASNIQQTTSHTTFQLHTPKGSIDMFCPIPGKHHILNVLAAAGCLYQTTDLCQIQAGIKALTPVKGRMNLLSPKNGVTIIDDTYNANPQSTKAALDYLSTLSGTKVFVFGDMGELGEEAEKFHAEIGEYAKKLGIDGLYSFGKLSAITAKSFRSGKHFFEKDLLNQSLLTEIPEHVSILFKGSRFTQMETCVSELCNKFEQTT